MRDNIMITFANQKGGVGKTTLCTMFADYLAAKGESVLVVDFDRQQTIYSKRNEDVEKYEGVRLPYSVHTFDIKDANNVREFLNVSSTDSERCKGSVNDALCIDGRFFGNRK